MLLFYEHCFDIYLHVGNTGTFCGTLSTGSMLTIEAGPCESNPCDGVGECIEQCSRVQ